MYPHNVVKRFAVYLFAMLTAASMILAGGALSAEALPTKRTNLYLNEAQAYQKNPYIFQDQFVRDANAAPKGSTLRIATYLWGTDTATNAVIRAHNRGVRVRMAVDWTQNTPQIQRLRKVLGTDRKGRSVIYQPKGSGLHHNKWANIHAKVITFSQTGKDAYVTYVGSGNLSISNLRDSSNEQQRYSNNEKLYSASGRYIDAIIREKEQRKYYKTKNGRVTSGSVTIAFYPGAPDIIYNAAKYYNTKKRCRGVRIDVAVYQISDAGSSVNKARALLTAAKNGCDVNFIYNYKPTRVLIGTRPAKYLFAKRTSGPLKGRYWVDLRNGKTTKQHIHNKEMLIKTPKSTRVFGGSANWLGPSRFINADTVTINTDPNVYRAYLAQWNRIWSHSLPPVFPKYDPLITSQTDGDPEPEYDSVNDNEEE